MTTTSSSAPTTSAPTKPVQALLFDLIGTCTDWKPGIVRALKEAVRQKPLVGIGEGEGGRLTDDEVGLGKFALEWRGGFFRLAFLSSLLFFSSDFWTCKEGDGGRGTHCFVEGMGKD